MNRRDFFILSAGAGFAGPWPVRAQQKTMPVIGYLNPGSLTDAGPFVAAFRQGLSDAGYLEGKNLTIEYRWAEGRYDRLPELAADLVSRKVDMIAAVSGVAARVAKSTTSAIPVVFMGVGDPVGEELVASLARPGGNLTGFSNL